MSASLVGPDRPQYYQSSTGLWLPATVDADGNLNVNAAAGIALSPTAADEAAFTEGTTPGAPLMGVVNPTDTPADGDLAVAALDAARNQMVNVQPSASGDSGQFSVTDTAQQLPAQACRRISQLQSDYSNSATAGLMIYWGYSSSVCDNVLAAGDATAPINVSNLDAIWAVCTSGDTALLNWAVEAA
jgi:hypothetical protein